MSVILSETTARRVPTGDKLAPRRHVTAAEYLAEDEVAERRSEFIEGIIVPMAGASEAHIRIVTNIVSALHRQTEERDIYVFSNDERVFAGANYYYPDAGVVAGVSERNPDTRALTNPVVLIEVLSGSTETTDRGVKLRHYRRLPSLRAYLLVSQNYALVEQYERGDNPGDWRLIETEGLDGDVFLPAMDCRLPMSAIYRRVSVADEADLFPGDDAPAESVPVM